MPPFVVVPDGVASLKSAPFDGDVKSSKKVFLGSFRCPSARTAVLTPSAVLPETNGVS